MFERRDYEPEYALLNDPVSKEYDCYGSPITTLKEGDKGYGDTMLINGDDGVGDNPNRYKQHGFFFNADNCIACHACEAACSEKNDNPAHIAFRSVGFVEGGTYPAYQRLNISMACNHCNDPVCLKGCPTKAYTKYQEYGAVLQDPDICFGCGYCTWVCPYNAPQLDPVKGQVSKCNMCVDRLEVGLKPACVSACLGNALDFGVVENIPENREQAKTEIPGFPRTDITQPNIRFQQTRTTQRDMHRVDEKPIRYHKNEDSGSYEPVLDADTRVEQNWSLKKLLGSHENAHIAFTLATQATMGAFLILLLGEGFGLFATAPLTASMGFVLLALLAVQSVGLFKLNMHLGKPHRFYRGFYNLRMSPVSREIAGVSLFFGGLAGVTLAELTGIDATGYASIGFSMLAMAGLVLGGYYMYRLYRIKARPFWNHWYTGASFIATGLMLGASMIILAALFFGSAAAELITQMTYVLLAGVLLEAIGLLGHARDLRDARSEGAASFYMQMTIYGKSYWLRNLMLAVALIAGGIAIWASSLWVLLGSMLFAAVAMLFSRALFYVVVIPTTMPGAFFWKNKGFEQHAREVGLADMEQLGVAYESHHKFDVAALWDTIRSTSLNDKYSQFKRIFTG